MKRKATALLLLFFFISAPFSLFAQDIDTIISADKVEVQPGNILQAKGNVIVLRGDISLKAAEMIFDENTNQIFFTDIKEFFDGSGISIEAQKATLSKDLSEGIIAAAHILIDDTLKIRAEKIDFIDNQINKVYKIDRVTSCEDCKNNIPLWHFTASSALNDPENKNVVYRNVTMRIRGLPVGYIPYLRLPSPEVDRARGFLIPEASISSNLGVGIKLPYFIPIGQSRDILLTPFLSPRTKTTEYRYRQKLNNGEITINGSFSDDKISDGTLRSYYKFDGNFKLKSGIKLELEAGDVNDDRYLDDYFYDFKNDLNTKVAVSKILVDENRMLNAEFNYVKDDTDNAENDEYYSLTGNYTKRVDQNFLPGNLILNIDGKSTINILKGNQVTRPPSSVTLAANHTNIRNIGSLQLTNVSFGKINSFVNSQDIESLDEEFVSQYGFSSRVSLPMFKQNNGGNSFISPYFKASFNGQKGSTAGKFFVGGDELSFGSISSEKRYTSLSESEQGVSFSTGLDYSSAWHNSRKLDISFAGLWLENGTYNQNYSAGFNFKKINYIGTLKYGVGNNFLLYGDTLFNQKGNILNGQLGAKFSINNFEFDGNYEFIDEQNDYRLNRPLENIQLSSTYKVFGNIDLSAEQRYDFSKKATAKSVSFVKADVSRGAWNYQLTQTFNKGDAENTGIAAIYDDDCTRVKISLQNKKQAVGSSSGIQLIAITIQLKPFASFSVPGF